jgi:uncharacterized protein YabE (DUF348 family)
MRHVLATPVTDQGGKGVVEGDQVIAAVEIVSDPVVPKSVNRAVERGQNGTKEKPWEETGSKTQPFKPP